MLDEVITLDGINEGVWKVYTETSAYIIDLDKHRGIRLPGQGLGKDDRIAGEPFTASIKGDNAWFGLITIDAEVGKYMELIMSSFDGFNWRRSTIVRRIEKLEEERYDN